jgi:hypothetical protein
VRRQVRVCGSNEGPAGRALLQVLAHGTETAARAGMPHAGVQQPAGTTAAGVRQLILAGDSWCCCTSRAQNVGMLISMFHTPITRLYFVYSWLMFRLQLA